MWIGATRYVQHPLGYPNERAREQYRLKTTSSQPLALAWQASTSARDKSRARGREVLAHKASATAAVPVAAIAATAVTAPLAAASAVVNAGLEMMRLS